MALTSVKFLYFSDVSDHRSPKKVADGSFCSRTNGQLVIFRHTASNARTKVKVTESLQEMFAVAIQAGLLPTTETWCPKLF